MSKRHSDPVAWDILQLLHRAQPMRLDAEQIADEVQHSTAATQHALVQMVQLGLVTYDHVGYRIGKYRADGMRGRGRKR